jgi:hypothetical protein
MSWELCTSAADEAIRESQLLTYREKPVRFGFYRILLQFLRVDGKTDQLGWTRGMDRNRKTPDAGGVERLPFINELDED